MECHKIAFFLKEDVKIYNNENRKSIQFKPKKFRLNSVGFDFKTKPIT